jgi:hypothetical protein
MPPNVDTVIVDGRLLRRVEANPPREVVISANGRGH